MEKAKEYSISAGTFARLCQTTRETLRYYQNQGILVPYIDESNGYHFYCSAQIASFYFIKTFRDLGCSVNDIKEYLLSGEEAHFDSFVDVQYNALLEEREILEKRIGIIGRTRSLLKEIRRADGAKPKLRVLPDNMHMWMSDVRSEPAGSVAEIMPDILRHLNNGKIPGVQALPMGGAIDREHFFQKDYSYSKVFSFADKGVPGNVINLSGRPCVTCVCRETDGEITAVYEEIQKFLEHHRLKATSDLYSLSIVNVIDPHATRRYLKYLFMCVED